MEPQTRRLALPNRIRYPTDCLFASSCSPLHFAMTRMNPDKESELKHLYNQDQP
jgi:hypothetical protein